MITNDEQMQDAVAEQAAEWFVANDAGALDEQESAALLAWLKASPIHVEEFLRVAGVARDLRMACADPRHSADAVLAAARTGGSDPVPSLGTRILAAIGATAARRWQTAAITVAALGVASLALLVSRNPAPVAPVPAPESVTALHLVTRHGEQQTRRLADDSLLHLNTDTDLTIRYSGRERLVTLARGEVEFEVTHDPGRPFRVLAGAAEVRDLGTTFAVRTKGDSTVITVVEGRVAVEPSTAPEPHAANRDQPVELHAGQQLSVAEGVWPATPVAVDATRTTAWLHRQIVFESQPLGQVVAEFNRYTSKPIEITTPTLRDLEISGVFRVDDGDAFIAFLRSLEGVQVDVTETAVRVSAR